MRSSLAALALAMTLALAACGGSGEPANDGASFDLTVGVLVPLRGDLAVFGPPGRRAADLAAAQAGDNAGGDRQGPRLRVIHADSETQPLAATIAARRLIKRGASCLVGDWSSASTIAVANQVAAKEGVPLISPASTNFGISKLDDRGFVFRTAPSDALQVVALAQLAERSLGGARGKTVALAARDDAYGDEFARRFAAEWRRRGGRVAGPVLYDPTSPAYAAEARRIVAGDPDGFVIADFPETYARLAPALVETGRFDAGRLFVSDTLAVEEAEDWDIPAAGLEGAQGVRPGIAAAGASRRFGDSFDGLFTAQTFDAVTLCYRAAVAAGSADPEAIRDEIRAASTAYDGASGPLNLDASGDPSAASFAALRFSSSGAPQPAGELAVGAPRRAP